MAGSNGARGGGGVTRRIDAGRGHSYQLEGRHVGGVTTKLGDGFPKPWLGGWAAREVAEFAFDYQEAWTALPRDAAVDVLRGAPWRDRDAAAGRGTEVHRLASAIVAGDEVQVPEELVGKVDAYIAWLDEYDPQDVLVERPCFSRRWQYGGTFDLWCRLANPHPQGMGYDRWLIDIKTNLKGPYGDTALQLAGYGHADIFITDDGEELPMPPVDRYGVLWLRDDGWELVPYDVGEREWRVFQYVDAVGRWIAERSDWQATDPVRGQPLRPQRKEAAP